MSTTVPREYIYGNEVFKETYKRKSFLNFQWFVKVKSESIKKEIIINCKEPVDLWLNGNLIHPIN
jgi:hypothetical protein